MSLEAVIFTRERAAQLDLLLRSIDRQRLPYARLHVIAWDGADDDESYRLLRALHPGLELLTDRYYCSQAGLVCLLEDVAERGNHVVFHTDDDVFLRRPSDRLLASVELPVANVTPTLRLGMNTIRCHPLQCEQRLPSFHRGVRPPLYWRWREAELDFGYPLSLNATIYEPEQLLPLLEEFEFENPTQLEAQLAARAKRFPREWMACDELSSCVSLPLNVVSPSSGNPRGHLWSAEILRERFLEGWRIDLADLERRAHRVDGAHCELAIGFERFSSLRA